MLIGVSMYVKMGKSLSYLLDFAEKLGYSSFELKLDELNLLRLLNQGEVRKIAPLLESFKLKYFIHAPYIDLNIASLNRDIAEASEKIIRETIEAANTLNINLVTFHFGEYSRDYPLEWKEKAEKEAIRRVRRLNLFAQELGVQLSVENSHKTSDYTFTGYPEEIREVIRGTGCKFTLDVGHANTFGNPLTYFRTFKSEIVNIHVHDNNGENDEHLLIGEGNIDFKSLFKEIKECSYSGPLIVELHKLGDIVKCKKLLNFFFTIS